MNVTPAMKEALMLGAMDLGNRLKNPWLRYGVVGFLLWQMIRMARSSGGGLSGLPNGWKMDVNSDLAVDMLAPGLGVGSRFVAKKLAREFVKGMSR